MPTSRDRSSSFDSQRDAVETRAFLEERDFDVVGVRRRGVVVGYAARKDLSNDILESHLRAFKSGSQFDETESILSALQALRASPHLFVLSMGQVSGIITKGDLQKTPVRMWLFGTISLVEMQFLRLIRTAYPHNSWMTLLSGGRIRNARSLLSDRQRRNEAIDLADCLQFCDKRTIIARSPKLREALDLWSGSKAETRLKELENLRDHLAHAQDIVTGFWPKLAEVAEFVETLLETCEDLEPRGRNSLGLIREV